MKKNVYYDVMEEIWIFNKISNKIKFIGEELICYGENITLKELLTKLSNEQENRSSLIKKLLNVEND